MARRALGAATLRVVQAVDALGPAGWVVACSGGADSLALAWAAGFIGRRRGTRVRAVVVDHGLQAGSDKVAARVVKMLAQLDAPHADALRIAAQVVPVQVVDRGAGPEASAREARYAALEGACGSGEKVLLGHTLDDQAETVLLGLARGSGARSLAGMASERGVFVRPLLGLGREVTRACCAELGLQPWADPHNIDPRYARVRVRERVLPVLEAELGPGVREALARTASLLRRDADALDAEATAERLAADSRTDPDQCGTEPAQGHPSELSCRWLNGLEPAIRDRVIRAWLLDAGASGVSAGHIDAVGRLVTHWRGQGSVHVPGLRVGRSNGMLTVTCG